MLIKQNTKVITVQIDIKVTRIILQDSKKRRTCIWRRPPGWRFSCRPQTHM